MNAKFLARVAPIIRSLSVTELDGASSLYDKLLLASDGVLEICYAPFEFINSAARVVIVGITPGRAQMINALGEARRQLDCGAAYPNESPALRSMI